ncbi:MAG: tetratricopeptide repeat protein [Notoacmeibacter sp.]|nr:tetratricopeptide repeat protein [Notoacmeibacter sp.]
MTHRKGWTRNLLVGTAMAVLVLGISGCANKRLTTGSIATPSLSKPIDSMNAGELSGASQKLGLAYSRDPKNRDTAINYARVLMMQNQTDQALAVMRKTAIYHAKDRGVLAAYGKALAAAGQFDPALDAIRRAQTPEYPDWKLVSAEGAILDQLGQTEDARKLYNKALTIQPGEPSILSNLGMSYVINGDLSSAERYLRQAAGAPGADSRVRQNLALVVGLQGRFQEAEQIASQELDPAQAQANVTYLRSILAQQNSWSKLSDKGKKATN